MRKEILFAILAGIVFGVVIAFGIWRTNSALNSQGTQSIPTEPTTEENGQFKEEVRIALSHPQDLDVITQSPIMLSGITKPNSWVVISTEEEDFTIHTKDSGVFEKEIKLVGGVNQILVYAFDKNGVSHNETLTLVYSTEFSKEK